MGGNTTTVTPWGLDRNVGKVGRNDRDIHGGVDPASGGRDRMALSWGRSRLLADGPRARQDNEKRIGWGHNQRVRPRSAVLSKVWLGARRFTLLASSQAGPV